MARPSPLSDDFLARAGSSMGKNPLSKSRFLELLATFRDELMSIKSGLSHLKDTHNECRQQLDSLEAPRLTACTSTPPANHAPPRKGKWSYHETAAEVYARSEQSRSLSSLPACSGNPLDSGTYSAQVMSLGEFERVAVPLAEASSRLPNVMEEYGFAIVTGVIPSEAELKELEMDFKADLRDLVDEEALKTAPEPVRRAFYRFLQEGPAAFPLKTVVSYLTQAAGFVLERCLGHGRFAWRVRRHKNVHDVFRVLFPGESHKLVSSLDVTFFTPGGQEAKEVNDFAAHCDQNKSDVRSALAECHTYQGVLYVWPSNPDGASSTTVVWPGSHRKVWPAMMEDPTFADYGKEGFHYCEIKEMACEEHARELADGWAKHARRVTVPPGSLFLWNSRTMHTGWRGGPRLAQAVCLEPESRRPEGERFSKLRLAALGLPACHWASAGMQHDMSLGAPGVFTPSVVRAQAGEHSEDWDGVVLPLRRCVKPAALTDDADMESLRELVQVPYQHCGMWEAPEECKLVLEDSIRADFAELL